MSGKAPFRVGGDEVVLADVCAPISSLTIPLLEVVAVTGVAWMAIGWMDVTPHVDAGMRNIVVLVWALLVLWRFVLPLVASRRRRFILTDKRILARGRRGAVDSIPLRQIHSVRREHGGLQVAVYGYAQPVVFERVGRTRAVEKAVQRALTGQRQR
ncbi:hypothetical protein [Corynebacterium fournieri]|uniref:hypothetical protein n=1 Tax=Corynebacterium fournieri TaxID=1852390 RepID=UPI000A2F20AD|nr:hypothetical protein [Corynebacterium fournieri]WJY96930.1 hypothetical protein CFOUR_02460 [Corynebacterium fournieri]